MAYYDKKQHKGGRNDRPRKDTGYGRNEGYRRREAERAERIEEDDEGGAEIGRASCRERV